MHALRRHQFATFRKEFTRELKIVVAETTVSALMHHYESKRIHAGEAVQEEKHSAVSSMESPMAEHGKRNMSTYSAVAYVRRN